MQSNILPTLPVPTHCDNCNSTRIEFTSNDKVYGRKLGAWPYAYYCNECTAAVGCHPNTQTPLGRMADRDTRFLRKHAHLALDPFWENQYMTRSKAYAWLAAALEIDLESCHISLLSKEQLTTTIKICTEYLNQNIKSLERRKAKKNAKSTERNKRATGFVERRKAKR